MSKAVNSIDILAISLSVLYNYFDGSTKLFSDLCVCVYVCVCVCVQLNFLIFQQTRSFHASLQNVAGTM